MNRLTITATAAFLLMLISLPVSADDVEVEGPIQSISSTEITVEDTTFAITSSTKFKGGNRASFTPETRVKVEGEEEGGVLTAKEIERKSGNDDDGKEGREIKVTGFVSAVSGDQFTVKGTTFTVNDDTEYDDGSAADLIVGAHVRVEGKEDDGTLYAKEINFIGGDDDDGDEDDGDDGEDEDEDELEIRGIVAGVGDDWFSIGSTTFAITGATKFVRMDRDDLVTGYFVEVKATGNETDGYTALRVKPNNEGEDRNGGKTASIGVVTSIEEIGEELLLITLENGESFTADEDTRLSGRHGIKSTAADLLEGHTVRIQYRMGESFSVGERREAVKIMVLFNDTLKGTTDAVGVAEALGSFTLNGMEILFDRRTELQDDLEDEDPTALPGGLQIVVLANPLADGTFLANRIALDDDESEDDNDFPFGKTEKFRGIVSGVSSDESGVTDFSIDSFTFAITADTRIRVKGYEGPVESNILEDGQYVKVKAADDGAGGWIAAAVTVYLPEYRFEGAIEALSAEMLTILGTELMLDEYVDYDDIDQADVVVGAEVEVKALLWPTGDLLVVEIEPADDDGELGLRGEIEETAVDGDDLLLTIAGTVVRVTPDTEIRDRGTVLTADDLVVGLLVDVELDDSSGELVALKVRIR